MKINAVLLLVGLLVISTVGCSNTKPPAMAMDEVSRSEYSQKVALDNLEHWVTYQAPTVFPETETTPFRVVVAVRNIDKIEHHIQYKFTFYNKDGVPIDSNQGWKFKTLPIKAREYLQSAALQRDVVDWDLVIRAAR